MPSIIEAAAVSVAESATVTTAVPKLPVKVPLAPNAAVSEPLVVLKPLKSASRSN